MIDCSKVYAGRLIFDHLPKTAGQAINAWLIGHLGSGCVSENLIGRHTNLISRYGGVFSVISAHVDFNGEGFDPRYEYVTLFREPIDRALSYIFFILNHSIENFPNLENLINEASEFVKTDGYVLGDSLSRFLVNPYVNHLASIHNKHIPNEAERLSASKKAIEYYDLWGLYECLPEFLSDFSGLLGFSSSEQLTKINVTNDRIAVKDISPQMRLCLENLLTLDIELYEWLKDEWDSRPNKAASKARESLWLPYERNASVNQRQSECFSLIDARLVNESNRLTCGDLLEFTVDFSVSRAFDELEIGIHVFDEDGDWAFGTNSSMLCKRVVAVNAGVHSITYSLVADMPEGDYKAGFGFSAPGKGGAAPADEIAWFDPFIEFHVDVRRVVPSVGYLGLPAVFSYKQVDSQPVTLITDGCGSLTFDGLTGGTVGNLGAGEFFSLPVVVHNDSSQCWRSSWGKPLNFSYCWEPVELSGISTDVAYMLAPDFGFNSAHATGCEIYVQAPDNAGEYVLVVSLAQDGSDAFNEGDFMPFRMNVNVVDLGGSRTYAATDIRLKTLAGSLVNGAIVGGDTTGIVMYGPYARLPAGKWVAFVEGKFDPANLEMYIDVVANAGDLVIAKLDVEQLEKRLELVFALATDVADLEVRLFCTEGSSVRVDSLSLVPVLS